VEILTRERPEVHSNPETWPAWTDESRFEAGPAFEPSADDAAWWAEHAGECGDADDPDALAAESAATDRLCAGLFPADDPAPGRWEVLKAGNALRERARVATTDAGRVLRLREAARLFGLGGFHGHRLHCLRMASMLS
jgi:hypothetical protein